MAGACCLRYHPSYHHTGSSARGGRSGRAAGKNRRGAFERRGEGGVCPITSHSQPSETETKARGQELCWTELRRPELCWTELCRELRRTAEDAGCPAAAYGLFRQQCLVIGSVAARV